MSAPDRVSMTRYEVEVHNAFDRGHCEAVVVGRALVLGSRHLGGRVCSAIAQQNRLVLHVSFARNLLMMRRLPLIATKYSFGVRFLTGR
jgi:hypothetical protein